MKSMLLAASAAALLWTAGPAAAQAPTPADAKAFIERAETRLAAMNEYANRAQWIRANFITEDSQWIEAKVNGEQKELVTKLAKEAATFDGVATDAATARKLKLLKLYLSLPAPDRPGAAAEVAGLATKLDSIYSTGKFRYGGRTLTLNDAEDVLAQSRDPAALKAVWEGWHSVAPVMKPDYARLAALLNEGSRGMGFKDTGALWRSGYDMEPDAFAAEEDRLWKQVEPFYRQLHCYVRTRLNETYGDAVQPKKGPIRADLLGNMWAQRWGSIYDVVQPRGVASSYSLDKLLADKGYDAVKMVKTGEGFYTSLGLDPLPQTFWERSLIVRPRDREVVCHASAWDLDDKNDIRIKMCTKVNADDFQTVHHELGHNFYQRAYAGQDFLFKNGANDGFHEAIGDFVGLSAFTPTYLKQIGLIDTVPGEAEDIPFLLKMALDKIAFMPFGLMVDKWRWQVFDGSVDPAHYNEAWWKLKLQYQGIVPPGPRPADAFDPGAKYHVAAGVPYARYFMAHVYEFQFQRAACAQAGWKGPLHRCSIYGQKAVGEKLNAMLQAGQSQPWPETLKLFTGESRADASAVVEYFKPLEGWLVKQNKGQQCGW
ncbi:M2 family metallopeptidase [Phenylobacterium sp.]|uniref:M2 family metallopeptidase n=1 Tax=Phenylobacterium sp. TaxID=1871053 RepID=UPI0025D2D4A5|nr:M2 family metallopeptidase [Phenylobacterium sp.]MBX3483908.1 M2 family metallopeptidase [Phenylobacterium sp.]MCW5760603.1 M2 family metallopeptidase [Phenylobacterium sp.]